jgi:hypothetical protein
VQTELSLKKAIQVDRDTLIIRDLLIQDPEIVSAVQKVIDEGKDERELVATALKIGVRVIQAGLLGADLDSIRKDLRENLSAAQEQFTKFFGKNGTDKSLVELVIESSIKNLNEEIKKRLISEFEGDGQVRKKIFELFDPKNQASSLGALKDELIKKMNPEEKDSPLNKLAEKVQIVLDACGKLQTDMGILKGERGTTKAGQNFEDLVFEKVKQIARVTGDVPENVTSKEGGALGERGRSKEGDYCLAGALGKIVIEAKSEKNVDIPTALRNAMKNRGAEIGILVYDESNLPKQVATGKHWDGQILLDGKGFVVTLNTLETFYNLARGFLEIHRRKSELSRERKPRKEKRVRWEPLLDQIEEAMSDALAELNRQTRLLGTQANNLRKSQSDLAAIKQSILGKVIELLKDTLISLQKARNGK